MLRTHRVTMASPTSGRMYREMFASVPEAWPKINVTISSCNLHAPFRKKHIAAPVTFPGGLPQNLIDIIRYCN